MPSELEKLRSAIDLVDKSLLSLIEERFRLTEQVGLYKLRSKESILQHGRWEELLSKVKSDAESKGLSIEMVEEIWNSIHEASVNQQQSIALQRVEQNG